MRETIKTHDAELYIGWPTADTDDPSVQVGVRYGVDARWAVLTNPEQVADLRRQLQRASRAVWPQPAVTAGEYVQFAENGEREPPMVYGRGALLSPPTGGSGGAGGVDTSPSAGAASS